MLIGIAFTGEQPAGSKNRRSLESDNEQLLKRSSIARAPVRSFGVDSLFPTSNLLTTSWQGFFAPFLSGNWRRAEGRADTWNLGHAIGTPAPPSPYDVCNNHTVYWDWIWLLLSWIHHTRKKIIHLKHGLMTSNVWFFQQVFWNRLILWE
jgi:hypothetical protein